MPYMEACSGHIHSLSTSVRHHRALGLGDTVVLVPDGLAGFHQKNQSTHREDKAMRKRVHAQDRASIARDGPYLDGQTQPTRQALVQTRVL